MEKGTNKDYRIAIDVGGTFVDFVLLDEKTGEITIEKQPSTPERIVDEVGRGLSRLPVNLTEVRRILHGTTVAINTIIQEKGVQVGLLTTLGFRDVLEIGRGSRPEIYNPKYRGPECMVPRYLRREIRERIAASGEEVVPLDLEGVELESDLLVREGCEAIAICFLNSYANSDHERLAVECVKERHPLLAVTCSSELIHEWREFERTCTTVLNAYTQPQFQKYVESLSKKLRADGYVSSLALMQSNGGVSAAGYTATRPIKTLESGPAGGVIGAHAVAGALQLQNIICFDVGGTTVDVALIEKGRIVERSQTKIGGRPVMGPTIDIASIGAGGGSIAWVDQRGALRVGPQSAGASPGPACFGHGGVEPTVTDCHLLLGCLDADRFLGSRMRLDIEAAIKAVKRLTAQINISIEEMANGVLKIAETNMTNAIRSITVERGLDPREYTLFSYGGGGGLFAAGVCDELEIKSFIVPRNPANFSAWGILNSDYREDSSKTLIRPLGTETVDEFLNTVEKLKKNNIKRLKEFGFHAGKIYSNIMADIRFSGQEFTVTVPIDDEWTNDAQKLLRSVQERFVELHNRLYGHGESSAPIELVAVRTRSVGRVLKPFRSIWKEGDITEPDSWRESSYFGESSIPIRIPVYNRENLVRDQKISGPAIIEEWTTTTLVPNNWKVVVDRWGNLVFTKLV